MIDLRPQRDRITEDIRASIRHELDVYWLPGPYILLTNGSDVKLPDTELGITSRHLALLYQKSIVDYCGNGPAWIVNVHRICRDRVSEKEVVAQFAATCAHELTHALEVPGICQDVSQTLVDLAGPGVRAAISEPPPSDLTSDKAAQKDKTAHSQSFIRLALHVRHRLQAMGWRVWLEDLLCWNTYAVASPGQYLGALKHELTDFEDLPLTSIGNIAAPRAFSELFEEPHRLNQNF